MLIAKLGVQLHALWFIRDKAIRDGTQISRKIRDILLLNSRNLRDGQKLYLEVGKI